MNGSQIINQTFGMTDKSLECYNIYSKSALPVKTKKE